MIEKYPYFKQMYDEIYQLCLNIEEVMGMFSKELAELDRNTVYLMIDQMQAEIEKLKANESKKDARIAELEAMLKENSV